MCSFKKNRYCNMHDPTPLFPKFKQKRSTYGLQGSPANYLINTLTGPRGITRRAVPVAGPLAQVGSTPTQAASPRDQFRPGRSREAAPGAVPHLWLSPCVLGENRKPTQRTLQLKRKTPIGFILERWQDDPERFHDDPAHYFPGPYT